MCCFGFGCRFRLFCVFWVYSRRNSSGVVCVDGLGLEITHLLFFRILEVQLAWEYHWKNKKLNVVCNFIAPTGNLYFELRFYVRMFVS